MTKPSNVWVLGNVIYPSSCSLATKIIYHSKVDGDVLSIYLSKIESNKYFSLLIKKWVKPREGNQRFSYLYISL